MIGKPLGNQFLRVSGPIPGRHGPVPFVVGEPDPVQRPTTLGRVSQPMIRALAALGLALGLTACGEAKVAQCNRLIETLNKSQAIGQEYAKANTSQNPSAEVMENLATQMKGLAAEVGQVKLSDTQLQQYQGQFAQVYNDLARASERLAAAQKKVTELDRRQRSEEGPANSEAIFKESKQIEQDISDATKVTDGVAKQEQQLVQDVNAYCTAP